MRWVRGTVTPNRVHIDVEFLSLYCNKERHNVRPTRGRCRTFLCGWDPRSVHQWEICLIIMLLVLVLLHSKDYIPDSQIWEQKQSCVPFLQLKVFSSSIAHPFFKVYNWQLWLLQDFFQDQMPPALILWRWMFPNTRK